MSEIDRSLRPQLQRNLRRRRIAGVCAGLSDYLGWDVSLVRVLFMLSLFFGGLGFAIYLALWLTLPAATEMPIPKVSWHLQRELRRMQKRIRQLYRTHDPLIADMAHESFEAITILVARFESEQNPGLEASLVKSALQGFPQLLDSIGALPPRHFRPRDVAGTVTPAKILLNQLADFRSLFQEAAQTSLQTEFNVTVSHQTPDTPELMAWRELLRPLQSQVAARSKPETLAVLVAIEEKLGFLLQRLDTNDELLDLRPFEVRKIAFEYLPDTLNKFVQLPATMARSERLISGKTAEESLSEQLSLLDNSLHNLAKSLFEKDAKGLLVHGRFLREKFAAHSLELDDDEQKIPT